MKTYKNYDLKNHTTSKISSFAKVVYIPESKEEFVDLLKTFDTPPVIIGGGSNVLLSSHGIDTPVILTTNLRNITVNNNTIKAQCGVKTGVLSKTAADNNLSGMEFLFVIPATVGGVVKMNSSAHSQSIKDIIISAEVFDMTQKKVLNLSNDELELSYRTSILQKKPLILLEAVFNLEKQNKELIDKRMQENLDYRKEKQPALTEPNFGSTFRNPQGAAVGKMIEELGLKGTVEGGAKISEIHGNFIVNYSKQATSTDVLRLMFKMYNAVKQKFGYEIKTEVIFIGNMTEEEKKIWTLIKSH